MGLKDSFAGGDSAKRGALQGALRPDEQLLGTLMATRRTGLKIRTLAVGVTPDRIILAPMSAKHADEVISLERADITGSSAKGLGMDWRKLAGDSTAKVTIESRTHGEVKLTVLGDDIPEVAVTGGPSSGVEALQEFLASTG